jgi:hypothetical protein
LHGQGDLLPEQGLQLRLRQLAGLLTRGCLLRLELLELRLQLSDSLLEPRFQLGGGDLAVRRQGDLAVLELLEHRLQLADLLLELCLEQG